MENCISIENLTKSFCGRKVVDSLSFDVKKGEVPLSGTGSCFTLPHFILIGMSVGGQNAPAPDASTPQSFEMLVDWIRVYAPEDYGYGKFSLSKDYYETPTIGAYEQLSPVFTNYFPNTTINWSSSNENVATVTGGKIFTTGVGECDIIARLKNNYSADSSTSSSTSSSVAIVLRSFIDNWRLIAALKEMIVSLRDKPRGCNLSWIISRR